MKNLRICFEPPFIMNKKTHKEKKELWYGNIMG